MTETLLNRSKAAEYIRKNADPASCLGGLDRCTLHHWLIDDYGTAPQSVDGTWLVGGKADIKTTAVSVHS